MSFNKINQNHALEHFSYPSITQYRNLITNVRGRAQYTGRDENNDPIYDSSKPLPKLKFVGTVKCHGTNASIVVDYRNDTVYFQSRENVITPQKDNNGFANYMSNHQEDIVSKIHEHCPPSFHHDVLVVYGEWCGGSIQKKGSFSGLEKFFMIFDICVINTEIQERVWLTMDEIRDMKLPQFRIFNIYDYPTYEVEIDFAYPDLSVQELTTITTNIEQLCPIGVSMGKESPVGEGMVYKCVSEGYNDSSKFWTKIKGQKHSVSNVKQIVAIDIEKVRSIKAFADTYVTENRCQQSIDKIHEAGDKLTKETLSNYIKWIVNDIAKEEEDTIKENGFTLRELGPIIANKSREVLGRIHKPIEYPKSKTLIRG